MRHETVTVAKPGFDFKAAGYLVSILSVFLLGAAAWPKPGDPEWILPLLIVGMAGSIVGMGLRYLAHLKQQKELHEAEAEARSANREQRLLSGSRRQSTQYRSGPARPA